MERKNAAHKKLPPFAMEPIVRPTGLIAIGCAHFHGSVDTYLEREKQHKLLQLAEHFGIRDPFAKGQGLMLAFRLAEAVLQGFQIVDKPPSRPGRPRGKGLDKAQLVRAVDRLRTERRLSIIKACEYLSRPPRKEPVTVFKDQNPNSLKTTYHSEKKHLKKIAIMFAATSSEHSSKK